MAAQFQSALRPRREWKLGAAIVEARAFSDQLMGVRWPSCDFAIGEEINKNKQPVAKTGSSPAARNADPKETRSTKNPTAKVKTAPARPAANPLSPVTVATTS